MYFVKIILTPCRGLSLVGLALYLVDWPTIVLQCFDTVGWVIWPVKIVSNMTYNVFGGTLNPTLLLQSVLRLALSLNHWTGKICCSWCVATVDIILQWQCKWMVVKWKEERERLEWPYTWNSLPKTVRDRNLLESNGFLFSFFPLTFYGLIHLFIRLQRQALSHD